MVVRSARKTKASWRSGARPRSAERNVVQGLPRLSAQSMFCALNLGKPCTTFRPAERGLAPERQLAFVFRAERTTAAYAFPQPNG